MLRTAMLRRVHTSNRSQTTSRPFGIIRRELDQRTSVISIEGELDLVTAPRLKWMLIDALEAGHEELVVDLSLATFMDSTALGVLVGVNRSLGVDARMAIACPRSNVLKIFEFSGLDEMFTICPTVDKALAYTRGRTARAG
jgi:anti-sigma B factor antagonist